MILDVLSWVCLAGAAIVLVALAVIDLKTFLLPNKLVAAFALLGLFFHVTTGFTHIPPLGMVYGACVGGGLLYAIRFVGNRIYNADTLGLGDVKLMAAAGLWLGAEHVLIAITLGGVAGLLHGVGLAAHARVIKKEAISLNRLVIPAGPGFIVGAAIVAAFKLSGVPIL